MVRRLFERVLDIAFLIGRVRRPLRTALATRKAINTRWELRDGASFVVRGGTSDMLAVREVILRVTYRLPRGPLGVVVDIGAHIGSFTARASGRAERVLAFEPVAANHTILKECRSAGAELEISHAAVTGDGRPARIYVHPTNTGQHSLFQHDPPVGIVEEVESISSSDLLARAGGEIDLLKVDVEGAEHEILTDELLAHTDKLIVEINDIGPGAERRLLDRLSRAGFSVSYAGNVAHAARHQT